VRFFTTAADKETRGHAVGADFCFHDEGGFSHPLFRSLSGEDVDFVFYPTAVVRKDPDRTDAAIFCSVRNLFPAMAQAMWAKCDYAF
jgi:hypothetical protein